MARTESMLSATLQRRAGLQSASDYTDYRRYASRRLKKLRRREGVSVKPGKNMQPHELSAGQWELAVLESERSWASAMAEKAVLEANAAQGSSLKNRIASKFAKAVKHSQHALALEQGSAAQTATAQLEIAVYAQLVTGEAALERQQWAKVAPAFAKVRIGVIALIATNPSASAVLNDLVATSVDTGLRLALAQQKQDGTADLPQVSRELTQLDGEFMQLVTKVSPTVADSPASVERVHEVQFRDHNAKVRHTNLGEHLLAAQKADKSHDNTAAGFEAALSEWQQCDFEVNNLIGEINAVGEQREQDLNIINTYVQFHLLSRRIQRDAAEAHANDNEAQRHGAVQRYDVVLQSCNTLAELPGVFNDDALVVGINTMQLYFQTLRTLALAKLYTAGSRESLALVNLAYRRISSSDSSMSDATELPVTPKDLANLKTQVRKELVRAHSRTVLTEEVLQQSRVRGAASSDLNFMQLPQPGEDLLLADLAVQHIEPVAVKPVFYDLAFNYVSAPEPSSASTASAAKAAITAEPAPKKKGWGLFNLSLI